MILRIMLNEHSSQLLLFVHFPKAATPLMIGLIVQMALKRKLAISIKEADKEEIDRQEYTVLSISEAMLAMDKQYPHEDGKEVSDTIKLSNDLAHLIEQSPPEDNTLLPRR